MKTLRNKHGNTIILVMVMASLSLAGVVFVMQQVGFENSVSIKAMQKGEASSADRLALGILIEKFSLKFTSQTTDSLGRRVGNFPSPSASVPQQQSPFFFVEPYPSLEELNSSSFKPLIASFRQAPDALSPDPNIKKTNSGEPIPLPVRLAEAKTDVSSGRCTSLSDPEGIYKNVNRPGDCLVTQFVLDTTKLATLEQAPSNLAAWRSDVNKAHRAFVVVPNLSLIPSDLLSNYFNQNSATFPTSGLDSKMVTFLKAVPSSVFPRVLDSLIVKVGGTLAEMKMPVPPEPAVVLALAQGQSEPVSLGGSTYVDVKTNSITASGTFSENQFQTYRNLTLPRQSAQNINSVMFTRQTTERVSVPRDLYTNIRYYGAPRINPSNDREGLYKVMARVQGLRGQTQEALLDLRVSPPPAPRCLLTYGPDRYRGGKELLQGEGFTININCNFSDSGHVDYANIGGISVSNFDNNPLSPKYKTGSVFYIRRNVVNQETIAAQASGPGGTWNGSESLNAVCVMNDPGATANFNSIFGSWPFSRTAQIVSHPMSLYSQGESSAIAATHVQNYTEACSGSSYCMGTFEFTYAIWDQKEQWCYYPRQCSYWNASLKQDIAYDCSEWHFRKCGEMAWVTPQTSVNGMTLSWEQRKEYIFYNSQTGRYLANWLGGRAVFAQIGERRDANCSIQKYHFRTQGCFTGDTLITMGDGSQKRASAITEKDLIFNPLYRVPTQVVKVVKGPEKKPLYQVGVGKDKIKVTEDHPFLTQRGWVRADELNLGEWLLGENIPRKVSSIKKISSKTPITVYNFELSTDVNEGHLVLANGIPTGELAIQAKLKNNKSQIP